MNKKSLTGENVDVKKQKIERTTSLCSYEISLELDFPYRKSQGDSFNIKQKYK